jgi:hypothetical protein
MLATQLNIMDKDQKAGKTEHTDPWVLIPPTVLADERLTAGEKLVYGRVFGFMQKHGYCLASNDYLARHIGMPKNTVRNHLGRLYEIGYLRHELIRDPHTNEVIKRRIYPAITPLVPPAVLPRTESTTPRTAGGTTPSTAESAKESIRKNIKYVNVDAGEKDAADMTGEKRGQSSSREESLKIEYYANLLAQTLRDHASIAYYRQAVRRWDPIPLLDKAKQIVADGGARKPAAVFAAWLKEQPRN